MGHEKDFDFARAKARARARAALAKRGTDTYATQGMYAGASNLVGSPVDLLAGAIETGTGGASRAPNSPFTGPGVTFNEPVGGSTFIKRQIGKFVLPSGAPATYQNISEVPDEYKPIALGSEVMGGSLPLMLTPFGPESVVGKSKLIKSIRSTAISSPKSYFGGEFSAAMGSALGAVWVWAWKRDLVQAHVRVQVWVTVQVRVRVRVRCLLEGVAMMHDEVGC